MQAGEQLSAWCKTVDSVVEELSVKPDHGLADAEAVRRRAKFGPNRLEAAKKRHVLSILKDQFTGIVIVLLVGAGALALLMGNVAEAIAIFAVILINAAIG